MQARLWQHRGKGKGYAAGGAAGRERRFCGPTGPVGYFAQEKPPLPQPPVPQDAPPCAILEAIGCTGPGLKGKAPVLSGLGADNRRSAAVLPQAGQAGAASPAAVISSKRAPQAVQVNSYKGMKFLLAGCRFPHILAGGSPPQAVSRCAAVAFLGGGTVTYAAKWSAKYVMPPKRPEKDLEQRPFQQYKYPEREGNPLCDAPFVTVASPRGRRCCVR